jgi:hypothetical protein
VAPPFDVLRKMITLRIHIDPVPETNAPPPDLSGVSSTRPRPRDRHTGGGGEAGRCGMFGGPGRRLGLCDAHSPRLGARNEAMPPPGATSRLRQR